MPGVRTVKIRPRNAGDFRIISKLVQRVCSYLRDPKVFQFERVLPDGFSNDEDIFFSVAPTTTWLRDALNGYLSKGPLETQSNSHGRLAWQGSCRQR